MSVFSPIALQLNGSLFLPGDPGYDLATPWNVAVEVRPRVVVAAADADDVLEVVRFANVNGLRVIAQRTGHGAVPYDGDDVILVHTGQLDELVINPAERTARIGAGVVWQQVIEAAAPHGLTPLAGSAPGVGVVGFLTGGGVGPLVRTYGLSSDLVRAFEVVTGDGRKLRVTPDEHADLFWGLRGGKGTLGIVTAVEIELLELPELYGGALFFTGTDASGVLHAWRRWVRDLPEHANTSIALLQLPPLPGVPEPLAGKYTVAVRFASPVACPELLEPIRAAATPILDTVGMMPAAAIGTIHADPVDPMPVHERSGLLDALTPDAVDALLAVAGPQSGSPQVMVELRLLGGALRREPAAKSAYCHRDAGLSLLVIGVPADPRVVPHTARTMDAMAPFLTGRELPNFGASVDPGRNARVYDEDTRTWLAALAEQHDPKGVFKVGQVVR
jgi:FAD/FMN-containing dehydrogenase